MIFRSDKTKTAEFHTSGEKGQFWKESEIATHWEEGDGSRHPFSR